MKFCTHCGSKAESDKKFCVSCGASLNSDDSSINIPEKNRPASSVGQKQSIENRLPKRPAERVPMAPKKKRHIIFSFLTAILLLTLYFVGAHLTSHGRLVASFDEAISNQEADKIPDLLSYRDSDQEISNEEAEAFLRYIEEHPDEGKMLVESVNEQSSALKGNQAMAGEDEVWEYLMGEEEKPIKLEKEGKFLFYDRYKLYIDPIYINLETDLKGTKLYRGEKEIAEASTDNFSQEVGPFLPGNYAFSVEYSNKYLNLRKEEQVELTKNSNGDTVFLSVDARSVSFRSNFDSSVDNQLIVNGEPVEFNVFSGEPYGPVAFDGSVEMVVEADFPWGKSKTETIALKDEVVKLDFPMDNDLKKTLAEAVRGYTISYMEAWEKGDVELVKNMHHDIKEDVREELDTNKREGYIYTEEITDLVMDSEAVEVKSTPQGLQATVFLKENKKFFYYHEDETPREQNDENYYRYTLIYQDSQWLVNGTHGILWSNSDFNKMERILEEPISIKIDKSVENNSDGKEVKKSKEVNEPESEKKESPTVAEESVQDVESNLTKLYTMYVDAMIESINAGDYRIVEPFIQPGSELEKTQRDLVKRLSDKDIKEELQGYEIKSIVPNGNRFLITVAETVKVSYSDGTSEVLDYDWVYTAVKEWDQYRMANIE